MVSRILSAGLLIVSVAVSDVGRTRAAPTIPTQNTTLYLPLVAQVKRLELVITRFSNENGCSYEYCEVSGYVRNLSNASLYFITVEMTVTWHSYTPGTPLPPYTSVVQLPTAFTVTLPGQVNPFSYELLLGKQTATFGSVYIGSSGSNSPAVAEID